MTRINSSNASFTETVSDVPDNATLPAPAVGKKARGERSDAEGSNEVSAYKGPQFCTDNGYAVANESASPVAAGTAQQQVFQMLALTRNVMAATVNQTTGLADFHTRLQLASLDPIPPLQGTKFEHVEYTSTLPGISADDAFQHLVDHPNEFFGASGVTIYPPIDKFSDGARVFLQEPGVTPPVWAPIEVTLDPVKRELHIQTLDGHPLRGTNNFRFTEGENGAQLKQVSEFQFSSFAAAGGANLMEGTAKDPLNRQHEIWQKAHAYLADNSGR